jgi:Tol biopolymer transport system component
MDFASRSRRRGAFAVAAATGVAALLGPASALAAHNVIEPISVAPDGAIGNDSSVVGDHLGDYGDMTPDGRFVVFASAASNLVAGDTNGVGDVFVRDRRTGVTELVSVGPKGVQGDGDSNFGGIATAPAISDDGRYVAFKSDASNLVKGDRNDLTDVFVRDRAAGTTERISGDGGGDNPGISPDGNFVAFETFDFDGDFAQDIYLRNRATGTIERISVSHDSSEVFGTSEDPVVAIGPVVAFASSAPNLVPDDGQSNVDVFVRDLSGPSPMTERVSVSSDGEPAGEFDTSRNPAITPDGRFVAFQSDAQNFTAVPQTRFFSDVFVRDRQAGTTVLASPNGAGGEASGQSEDPEISADGRFVAFASFASDLIADAPDPDGELVRDAFVRDLQPGPPR